MLFRSLWFCLNFVIAVIATFAAMLVLSLSAGLKPSFAVLVILPLIIASMVEGQAFGRHYSVRPTNKMCWIASLRMTAMIVLMCLVFAIPRVAVDGGDYSNLTTAESMGRAAAVLIFILIAWCLLRLGYSIGLATELKGQQFSDK